MIIELWRALKKALGFGPKARIHPPGDPYIELTEVSPKPPPVTAPRRSFILVVDDEEGVRTVVADSLEKAGYKVCTASDGWQAVVQSEGFNVSLVVTDIAMPGPGSSGIDAYKKLRASPYVRRGLPIIFITGVDPVLVDRVVPKGDPRTRLFYKPVDIARLLAAIKDLLADSPS